jgi:cellulose synthase/poly-beta-1,6-N-acetylglucosamine synthase-like glycosyltransferase
VQSVEVRVETTGRPSPYYCSMQVETQDVTAAPPVAEVERADVAVVIPAWNEEASIGRVIDALPVAWHRRVVVADNNSTDYTADVARKFGATVVPAPRQGYGSACLAALAEIAKDPPQAVAFIDADFSDHPEQLPEVVGPVVRGEADLVLASRMMTDQPKGALLPQAVLGNALACGLIRVFFGVRYTDLGPFRCVSWRALQQMQMADPTFGWTVEMQVKAAKLGLRTQEIPARYRPRVGVSKITGTVKGTVKAGTKILWVIFRHGLLHRRR